VVIEHNQKSLRTAWRNLVKAAAKRAGDEAAMQSIAGHMSKKMLDDYTHVRIPATRTAVEALGGRLIVPEPDVWQAKGKGVLKQPARRRAGPFPSLFGNQEHGIHVSCSLPEIETVIIVEDDMRMLVEPSRHHVQPGGNR
jgi:hypothetical protein